MNSTLRHADPSADEQAALWAARLDGSVLSASDRADLDAWLAGKPSHRVLLSSYCQLSADLEQRLPLITDIREQTAEIPQSQAGARLLLRPRWSKMAGATLAAAAAVALLLFWTGRPPVQSGKFTTSIAQRNDLFLADGTRVELNAQTALAVHLTPAGRRVRLSAGQAFFTVTKDPARPFIVETTAGSVRVTGTQFDVRAEPGSGLDVTVAEGAVQVRTKHPGDAPVLLDAGERLSDGAGRVAVRRLSAGELDDALAWRRGQAVFRGVPLQEALARFARYHGRNVFVAPDVADLRIGGRFSLDDLDGFFSALEAILPVRVARETGGAVRVESRGTP